MKSSAVGSRARLAPISDSGQSQFRSFSYGLDGPVFERAILRVFNFVVSDRDLLRLQYHFEGDAVIWAASADADSVKKVLAYSVETYVRAPPPSRLAFG